MSDWIDIRRKAQECHLTALALTKGERQSDTLLAAALKAADLQKKSFEPGTTFNEGVVGMLDRNAEIVYVQKGLDPDQEAMVLAHELGHFHIHTDPLHELRGIPDALGGDLVDGGTAKVEGYSPNERNEVQANVFADEFLCPSDWLRDEYISQNRRPAAIAQVLCMPVTRVINQLIRALLLPPVRRTTIKPAGPPIALDPSQHQAATWKNEPLLVDAGPGTGKTRTLVHRVKHYLENGSSPASILALTFSNKAAEEMRERIAKMDAEAALQMWVGTFHSFGWELVKKWPTQIGRSEQVRLLDEAEALALLENNLERLNLTYYQNLVEPVNDLAPILKAISRCKDELISPEAYRHHAQLAKANALDEDSREKAEHSLEIAGVYEVYEVLLAEANAVDFGDLVSKALVILEKSAGAKHWVSAFKHVLVDEYQDVNLASSRMLQFIAKTGAVPWVVADQRQSIYRFRGAEPTNVDRFEKEFGGERHSLSTNYRSFAPVVRTFESFSSFMGGGGKFTGKWKSHRENGGEVTMTTAPDVPAEGEAMRQRAQHFVSKDIPYSEQVILSRTHLTLSRITAVLERLDVPLLYLGDLFERPEIRDLLSVVALGAEPGNIGLARVAALPEYKTPKSDALAVSVWADANGLSIFEALKRVEDIPGLTEQGRKGLAGLGTHLEGLQDASPWSMLAVWLFERSAYLQPLLTSGNAKARQDLIAIYHFMKVCSENAKAGRVGRREFLKRIRRIEALNQDTPFRAVSSEASDIDAIRVMTIHGSKGLEFGAVHFPAIAATYTPKSFRKGGVQCPPPPTLPHLEMEKADHEAEEEGLFFVGLSRARDYLSLSRAEKYAVTNRSSASSYLAHVGSYVKFLNFGGTVTPALMPELTPRGGLPVYPEKQLSTYMECPAKFQHMVLDKLKGARDDNPYALFHRCVYITVDLLEKQSMSGQKPSVQSGLAHLARVWVERGPVGHGFEQFYRAAAETMVKAMCNAIAVETGQYARGEWLVPLSNGVVSITPDRVLIEANGIVRVQRTRTGKRTKSEPDKPIYALLHKGAALHHSGKRVCVEIFYLSSGEVVAVPMPKNDKRLSKYEEAIDGILKGNFNIPATIPRYCPNCPAYFACGSL